MAPWATELPPTPGPNPCIALFGEGPEGAHCGGCVHLEILAADERAQAGGVFVCRATNEIHRATMDACSGFRLAPLAT